MINRRMRRLRGNPFGRELIRETHLNKSDLIYPIFVVEGKGIKKEIASLPNCFHLSIDMLEGEIEEIYQLGLRHIILFGVPNEKDECGSSAFQEDGIIQRAVRRIKEVREELYVITDVCLCEYTDHGHCGLIDESGMVNNDETLKLLSKTALSHVRAGADMVAPSDMMDFRVAAIRECLDQHGYAHIPIMAYSAKYASSYYGPFREAANSAPKFSDRKSYQMDYANSDEALREMELDIEEGSDIIMIKPALSYLDIIRRGKDSFNIPIAAYQVSGEYAMLKMAVENGLMNEDVIAESLVSIKRAGADIIITYFAKEIAKKLK